LDSKAGKCAGIWAKLKEEKKRNQTVLYKGEATRGKRGTMTTKTKPISISFRENTAEKRRMGDYNVLIG